jgi:hypothetical protein
MPSQGRQHNKIQAFGTVAEILSVLQLLQFGQALAGGLGVR